MELPSTSAQFMPASSSARTTDGMGSPPHTTTPSHTPSSFSHHSDLPPHPMPPRSPMVVHPTPSCSLAAANSTVPSPFSSSPHSQRPPTLSRPLSHPSPLLNRSYSESCLSSGHPLFGPGMGQPHSAMDAMTHALHGPMSPPPQGCHPHSFRAHLGGYNPPTSQHYGGKSFPCKSKSSHKSFGQTSSQVTSHLVRRQVKSQVIWSKHKSSHKSLCPSTSQVAHYFVQL